MKLSEKGIFIRETMETDLHQIYSAGRNEPLFAEIPFELNPENLAGIFASENSILLTAARKKKVLGFISGSVKECESRIHWMIVKETFRKTGIGTGLLKSYIEISKKNGAENFIIDVFKNTPESVNFFTKNGFSVKENFVELSRKI